MNKIILHKGKRKDSGAIVTGFLTKMWGEYHILMEENENTAYPVVEDSIEPCLDGANLMEKPWTMWYAGEDMLPKLKDTVLICKGYYDNEKYKSIYKALRAYVAKNAGLKLEDVCYEHVLDSLLLPACEAFLSSRKFCEMFKNRIFDQDIVMRNFFSALDGEEKPKWRVMNADYLIDLLADALLQLSFEEFQETRKLEDGFFVI